MRGATAGAGGEQPEQVRIAPDRRPPPPTGGLSLAVEGPSKAEITCKDKDGTCTVSYSPHGTRRRCIIVRSTTSTSPGSPFTAKITGWGRGAHPST